MNYKVIGLFLRHGVTKFVLFLYLFFVLVISREKLILKIKNKYKFSVHL